MKRLCNIYFNGELIVIVREDFLDFLLLFLRILDFKDEDLFVEYDDYEDFDDGEFEDDLKNGLGVLEEEL